MAGAKHIAIIAIMPIHLPSTHLRSLTGLHPPKQVTATFRYPLKCGGDRVQLSLSVGRWMDDRDAKQLMCVCCMCV